VRGTLGPKIADEQNARNAAKKLRVAVAATRFPDAAQLKVTISAGISNYPGHGTSRDQLLKAADVAMYSANRAGKNQVVVSAEGRR